MKKKKRFNILFNDLLGTSNMNKLVIEMSEADKIQGGMLTFLDENCEIYIN